MSNVLNYTEQPGLDNDNKQHFGGTVFFGTPPNEVEFTADKLKNVNVANDVTEYDANGVVAISGVAIIAGGTGLASMTLAAPEEGCEADIQIGSITSGTVVLTTPAGVTFDGTNNTATFNAVADRLVSVYKSATEWRIILNTSVVLSSV